MRTIAVLVVLAVGVALGAGMRAPAVSAGDGGPPGFILSGTLVYTNAVTGAESATGGSLTISRLSGEGEFDDVVIAAVDGRWELRAVPNGQYRVAWEPPFPIELIESVSPPLVDVVVNPNFTQRASVREVTVDGADVGGLDFSVRARVVGGEMPILPRTGANQESSNVPAIVLGAALAAAAFVALGLYSIRRRQ